MNRTSKALLLLILLCQVLVFTAFRQGDDAIIAVIANEKGAPASLTMKELKAVVQGEKQRWPDGTRISIAFMKTSTPVGSSTARKILNSSGDQLNKLWLALVFQGKAKAPTFFATAQEMETYVNTTPGAIGIIDASFPTKARILSIDEKKSF